MDVVYKRGEQTKGCYLLLRGGTMVEFTPEDTWRLPAKNLIIGALELILERVFEMPCNRLHDLYVQANKDDLLPVKKENFYNLLERYGVGHCLSVYFCQMFSAANEVFLKYREQEGQAQKSYEARAKLYYKMVSDFEALAGQFHFSDMVKVAKTFRNEIFYELGKIYSAEDTTEYSVKDGHVGLNEYSVNTKLCEQGEIGKELFILKQGAIDVFIDDDKVTTINRPGTVIGEMAFFLGKKRAATLVVSQPSLIVILNKNDVEEFHKENPDFFTKVVMSVSVQVYRLISKIRAIYDNVKQQERVQSNLLPDFIVTPPGEAKLVSFCKAVDVLFQQKRLQAVKEFIERHQKSFDMYLSLQESD